MPRLVEVVTGYKDVVLPGNGRHQAGDQVVLTDFEFSQVATAVTAGVLTDLGSYADGSGEAGRDEAIADAATKYVPLTQKGATNGVATLGGDSKLTTGQRWEPPVANESSSSGLAAWNFDPMLVSPAGALLSGSGVLHLAKVVVPAAGTVDKVAIGLAAAGITLTNCFVGIYDAAGTRLAVSADQSSSWATFVAASPTRVVTVSPATALTVGQVVYVAVLATGLTLPSLLCSPLVGDPAALSNVGLVAADGWRFSTSGTGLSALPSSVTLSSAAASAVTFWCGLK